MLTIQVADVEALKINLLPLLHLSHIADFRFSRSTVSLTVARTHNTSCLYVQLELSEPFFTVLAACGRQEFHNGLQIDNFFLATSITGTDDRILTFLIPDDLSFTNFIFTTRVGHLRYCYSMEMGPPLNIQVGQMDGGPFVAVDSEYFRDIAIRLSTFNTRIWITAKVSQVNFSAVLMEFNLPVEERRCKIGGTMVGEGFRFSVTLIPLQFFIDASYLQKMVCFHRSTDGRTLVVFETGHWSTLVAYNPQDFWEVLNK